MRDIGMNVSKLLVNDLLLVEFLNLSDIRVNFLLIVFVEIKGDFMFVFEDLGNSFVISLLSSKDQQVFTISLFIEKNSCFGNRNNYTSLLRLGQDLNLVALELDIDVFFDPKNDGFFSDAFFKTLEDQVSFVDRSRDV